MPAGPTFGRSFCSAEAEPTAESRAVERSDSPSLTSPCHRHHSERTQKQDLHGGHRVRRILRRAESLFLWVRLQSDFSRTENQRSRKDRKKEGTNCGSDFSRTSLVRLKPNPQRRAELVERSDLPSLTSPYHRHHSHRTQKQDLHGGTQGARGCSESGVTLPVGPTSVGQRIRGAAKTAKKKGQTVGPTLVGHHLFG